jgi:hypothetical protein
MHNEAFIKEYQVANENIRYFGNLSLAEITICVGVTGGLLTVLFSLDAAKHPSAGVVLKSFGLITSICFSIITASSRYALFHFAKRAVALEKQLEFKLWSTLPGTPTFRIRPNLYAVVMIHLCIIIFWVCALYRGDVF